MKKSILSGYLWGYDKPEIADVTFRKFKEFYPDGNLQCTVDLGGKVDEFQAVCDKWGANMKVNPINVGRCGFMGHYEKYEKNKDVLNRLLRLHLLAKCSSRSILQLFFNYHYSPNTPYKEYLYKPRVTI